MVLAEVLSKKYRRALTGQKDLSDLSDLSRVGTRDGIANGATLSGPCVAS